MWCILIPILVGLLSALLGYLLGKANGDNSSTISGSADADSLRLKISKLEADLAACRASSNSFSASASAASAVAFDAGAAKAAFGSAIKQDDLKIIEGIGPKIEQLFHAAGIKTWAALAAASFDTCKKILDDAGDAYKMHNPATWPDQAKLAAEGKFAELKKWQDELDGGK